MPANPIALYPWRIDWIHRSGGVKRQFYLGQKDCPITAIKFELNKSGCGAGDVFIANIDFPIDPDDRVVIYHSNAETLAAPERKYMGYVKTAPDQKGGVVQLQSLKSVLNRAIVSRGTVTLTVRNHIIGVLSGLDAGYGITAGDIPNPIPGDPSATATYVNIPADQVLDDLVGKLPGYYWGVSETGGVFVRTMESTIVSSSSRTLDGHLYLIDNPAFSDITVSTDYSGIEGTRAIVYCKAASGSGTILLGTVGYSTSPSSPIDYRNPLPIENVIGVKEIILNIPYNCTVAEGLAYAKNYLDNQKYFKNIELIGVNIDRYDPQMPIIGKLIQVQDRQEFVLSLIETCDSDTYWNGAILDNTYFIEGTGSVKFTTAVDSSKMRWTCPSGSYVGNSLKSIQFMIMSDHTLTANDYLYSGPQYIKAMVYGGISNAWYGKGPYSKSYYSKGALNINHVTYSRDKYSRGTYSKGQYESVLLAEYPITLQTAYQWELVEIPITEPFSSIEFIAYHDTFTSGGSIVITTVYVDRITVLDMMRNTYQENIVQANFSLTPGNVDISLKLYAYELIANETIFKLNKTSTVMQRQMIQ